LSSAVKDYYLINRETGCQYLFMDYSKSHGGTVEVQINDGHGWRKYDDAMVAGNYAVGAARLLWNDLVEQGFTINKEL
tara:strand:- start:224 stop:457 length:234 start_codon:yes stop_codon:yes gene_type:complete